MSHWAQDYVLAELAWEPGGRGPHAFDCWGLFAHVQRSRFGREVGEVDVDAMDVRACMQACQQHNARARWSPVPERQAQEGDAVLMAHARHPSHVGVWVDADGGGVLHCVRGMGAVFSPAAQLARARWRILEVLRYVG